VLSYAAFKLRDKRKPKPSQETVEFFHRYRIEEDEAGSGGADGGA
jgi:hypothetical protein